MAACWNCHSERGTAPLCASCGKVQPIVPGQTHFDVFGLPRRFDLSVPELEKLYREVSLKVHPDRFAHAEAKERRFALEQTAALNEALKALKDPARRAFYLLKLRGLDLEKEDAAAQARMPHEFLEEVMALREELAEARSAKDVAHAQRMGERVEKERRAALETAVAALGTLERDSSDARALETASYELARVRYFQRFLDEVAAIEEEAL